MCILVGKKAPDFITSAVLESGEIVDAFQLSKVVHRKYGLLFFYPLDFTFVCPSELIALDHRIEQFKARDVVVIGISVDSQFVHNAWRNTPVEQGGIGEVKYTLVADLNHSICRAYGIEHPEAEVALRGSFLIDTQGFVRAQLINDLPIGRNVDELIRLVDALQFHEEFGEVCPAGWNQGDMGMIATPNGVASYLANYAKEL